MLILSDLEPEILTLILEFVNDASPATTRALACVCRYFNELTQGIGHRHKTIDIHGHLDDNTVKKINSWDNELILANIRTLTVKGWFDDDLYSEEDISDEDDENEDEDDQENPPFPTAKIDDEVWMPVSTLVRKIARLRCLSWNIKYPIPKSVLDAFESQVFSTLRIFHFVRAIPYKQEPDEVELRLSRSKALTHIRYVENMDSIDRPDVRAMAFRSIVASAPNLEYAGFLNNNRSLINDEHEDAIEKCKPAFYRHKKPNSSIRQLTLDGPSYAKYMDALNDWPSIIDLTTIENVKFSRAIPTIQYFNRAATLLPNIKHLSLNLLSARDGITTQSQNALLLSIQEYIKTCSPLQTLSLWSWHGCISLSEILERHGASLRILQLHEREFYGSGPREILSLDDIKAIGSTCTQLQEFTFDMNRSDAKLRWDKDENKEYYNELAKFPLLSSLQIYLDLGVDFMYSAGAVSSQTMYDWLFDYNTDDGASDDEVEVDTHTKSNPSAPAHVSLPPVSNGLSSISAPAYTSPPSPLGEPPSAKRQRLTTAKKFRPSRDTYLEPYTKQVWRAVFGSKIGRRNLDVKVGEWETSINFYGGPQRDAEWKLRRHFEVRPHERDDIDDVVVKRHCKAGSRYS